MSFEFSAVGLLMYAAEIWRGFVYLMVTLCRIAVLCLLLIVLWQIILHVMGWGIQSLLCICCNTPDIWGSHVTIVRERGLNADAACGLCSVQESMARVWLQKYQTDGQSPECGIWSWNTKDLLSVQGSISLPLTFLGRNVLLFWDIKKLVR